MRKCRLVQYLLGMAATTFVLLSACSKNLTPEQARLELERRAYSYTESVFLHAVKMGDIAGIQLFIQAGMDVNVDSHGNPALLLAAGDGYTDVVRTLIKVGAYVDGANADGVTPLIYAASKGHVKVVAQLIKAGADVNAENSAGETALTWATMKGHVEVVNLLTRAGAGE